VRSEGNMSLKNPVIPPGIDPRTVRLVAQRLNHYATPGPILYCTISYYKAGSLCSFSDICVTSYGVYIDRDIQIKTFKNSADQIVRCEY
jgi:hypothetical protein